MNLSQEKMRHTCKIMKIVTLVFCIQLIVQIILSLFVLIVYATQMDGALTLFGSPVFFTSILSVSGTGPQAVSKLCAEIALCGFSLGALLRFYAMFSDASQDGHPFSIANAKRLRTIGIIMLVASIVVPTIEMSVLVTITNEKAALTTDTLPLILLTIVFFFFSTLFSYGAQLQQQADETL